MVTRVSNKGNKGNEGNEGNEGNKGDNDDIIVLTSSRRLPKVVDDFNLRC